MDRRLLTVLGVSLLFALVISAMFYQVVAGKGHRRKPVEVDKRELVVAAHAVPVGIILKDADVKVVKVPVDQFPEGCFSKTSEVVGRPVALNILANEPIRNGRLAPAGSGLGLAPAIPPGMRAVAVKVNDVVGVAGFVLPGMRVDVLATGRPPESEHAGSITRTVLQNILVLSAGQTLEPSATGQAINAPVVTLMVTPQQAETLTLAGEWRIQLVLRNGSDRQVDKMPGRELWELAGTKRPTPTPTPKPPQPVVTPLPKQVPTVVVFRGNQRIVEQVGAPNQ